MLKEDFLILIVDDDATMGKAMSDAVVRLGFKVKHLTKPDEALAFIKLQPIHALVVDCMLPKMNGRELAKKVREEVGPEIPIFFVSGIYRDRSFAKEAVASVGAKEFFIKPFDMSTFMVAIQGSLQSQIEEPLSPLNALLVKSEISYKERIKMVNQTEQVHGFDLPLIYSFLMHPKVHGHLNMVTAEGQVCGVGFDNGRIVQVNQDDARSFFGVLMVESGFITQTEMDGAINQREKSTKKIGERLVEANVISPHAISLVVSEQQGIRLSRTVADTSVKINFIETDEIKENAVTDRTSFTEFTNEWMTSKFTLAWLKSFYLPWAQFSIVRGPDYSSSHRIFTTSVLEKINGICDALLEAATLEQAFSKFAEQDDDFYRALHLLVIARVIRFGKASGSRDFAAHTLRLTKLVKALETQNHFERLGVSQRAKESEIKRNFHDLAKVLHPDKLDPNAPQELRLLTKKAFEMINAAHATLSEMKSRENYILELERGRADKVFAAAQLTEQVPALLTKGDITKATAILEQAISLAPATSEARVLYVWARLKKAGAEKNARLIETAKDDLAKIPVEDRHNANYLFVKALIFKMTGDLDSAKRTFDHCVSMYPDSIDARRELASLNSPKKQDPNLLSGDLKDVVGLLFKKKK